MTSQETHRNSYHNEESEEGELIISSSLFTPFIIRVSMDKNKKINQNFEFCLTSLGLKISILFWIVAFSEF